MAPEQIEGSEPDARGDVYGLACVLYEMLTGAAPSREQTGGMAKMWAQVNAEPPSVREARPDVPPALDDLILRALAKAPDARPIGGGLRGAGAGGRGRAALAGPRSSSRAFVVSMIRPSATHAAP